ncbi:S9 family peptidase [Microbacterium sp.]|uniref:S9 family peptidase n=1 Tax=Microbacterium sp. TaxID=51671 RepID=UPI002F94B76F
MSESWRQRFATPLRYSVKRAAGDLNQALVVTIGPNGPYLERWREGTDSLTAIHPIDGDLLAGVPAPDGEGVIRLRDGGGTELGHAWLASFIDRSDRDLTPDLPPYSLRGIDVSASAHTCLLTAVHSGGFDLWLVQLDESEPPRRLYRSEVEAWNGKLSTDGSVATVDSTSHLPDRRRFGVTALQTSTGEVIGTLFDAPDGTARAVTFSPLPGDNRLLVVSERSGFARPAIWTPATGARTEYAMPDFVGDVHPLDWSPDAKRILVAHVDGGVHVLYEVSADTGKVTRVPHPQGAVFQPSIVTGQLYVYASHYAADGTVRITRQAYHEPLQVLSWTGPEQLSPQPLLPPHDTPAGARFTSWQVRASDGMSSQLWLGTPAGGGPWPTVLELHGGPTFVTTDHFDPVAQAWIDEGFAFASLNYRGSVTFGREFRESFVGRLGVGEIEDVRSAAEFLVASGHAAPGEVFITGESYGGYLTLLALGKLPDLFAGGWAHVAMADWALAYPDMSPALQRAIRWFLGGTPDEAADAYTHASALSYVDDVRSPVWIRNGRNDTRTPPRQIEAYVAALREAGGDVSLEWFDGGHQTVTVDELVRDQQVMLELARRALRGEPWTGVRG